MHAVYPWNMTLIGRISSRDSLLVLRLNVSSTPHAWTPRDLDFSLTNNWCVVWDPPLVAQLCCLSHWCSISHRPHYIHEDTLAHPGDRCLTTLWYFGARALRNTGPCRAWDPPYVGPPLLVVKQRPRTGRYTSPLVSSYIFVQRRD